MSRDCPWQNMEQLLPKHSLLCCSHTSETINCMALRLVSTAVMSASAQTASPPLPPTPSINANSLQHNVTSFSILDLCTSGLHGPSALTQQNPHQQGLKHHRQPPSPCSTLSVAPPPSNQHQQFLYQHQQPPINSSSTSVCIKQGMFRRYKEAHPRLRKTDRLPVANSHITVQKKNQAQGKQKMLHCLQTLPPRETSSQQQHQSCKLSSWKCSRICLSYTKEGYTQRRELETKSLTIRPAMQSCSYACQQGIQKQSRREEGGGGGGGDTAKCLQRFVHCTCFLSM